MKIENIMKKSFLLSRAAALVFAAVLSIGMANCDMPGGSSGGQTSSNGLTTIRVTGKDARTIMPAALTRGDISKYIITLTNGTETIIYGDEEGEDTSAITGSGVKLNLGDGEWTVIVDAYRLLDPNNTGVESFFKAATGTGTITVLADGDNTLTITLNPISLEEEEDLNGVFKWNLKLPQGTTLTTFTLGGDNVDYIVNNEGTSGSMEKAGGVYELNIVLTKDETGQNSGISEVVHIYPGLISAADYDFTPEGDDAFSFAERVNIAGSLNITRAGPPDEAVAYTVQAYSDETCSMAIAGAHVDIAATNITSGQAAWRISIPAAAYAALSTKTIYLKADVSTLTYLCLSQPVTTAANIGLQGAAGQDVSINVQRYVAAPGLPVVTAGNSQLTVSWGAVSGVSSYEVWTNTSNNSGKAKKWGNDISGTSAAVTGLKNGTIYYVWVKAKSYGAISNFSPVTSEMPGSVFQGLKLTINTGSSNTDFILPIKNQVTNLNLTIDWGDGNIQTVTTAPVDYNGVPHTYPALNTDYVIKLTGSCYTNSTVQYIGKCGFGFYWNGGGYNEYLNKSKVKKAAGNITALTTGSTVTDFAYTYLFAYCPNLTDISGLVFSETGVARYCMLHGAFYQCTGLTSLPNNFLSGITTNEEYFLYETFYKCTGLTSLPDDFMAGITMPRKRFLGRTFAYCSNLTSLPANFLSHITTTGAYFLHETFINCTSLTSLPANFLSNITTRDEGNLIAEEQEYFLYRTFYDCTALTSLPANFLSGITAAREGFLEKTFDNCVKLNYIDLFSDGTTLTTHGRCMILAFEDVASSASPKLTLRIHGTTVFPASNSAGLSDSNVLKVQVSSNLVQAYKDSPDWSAISDSKFTALP